MYSDEEIKNIMSSFRAIQQEVEQYNWEDSSQSYFNFYYKKYLAGEAQLNYGAFYFNFRTNCLVGTAVLDFDNQIFYIEDEYDVYIVDDFEDVFAGRKILQKIVVSDFKWEK